MEEKIKKVTSVFRSFHCRQRNIIDGKFRENGIYFGQPPILKYLSENKNATQKEIADYLHISAPSVATSLKRMEEAGLVVRLENKADARRNTLKLTQKGKELSDFADNLFFCVDDATIRALLMKRLTRSFHFLKE